MSHTAEQLTAYLERTGVLQTPRVVEAFRSIDRADFVLPEELMSVTEDRPLPIGHGQTISQPSTVAMMLEWLGAEPGEQILDVGCGSGWTTALLGQLVGSTGRVIGVEIVPELVTFGQANLAKYHHSQSRIETAGKTLGYPKAAPFDRVLASASAPELPEALVKQLKIGGKLVIPVGSAVLEVVRRADRDEITRHEGFAFVPLIE